MGTDVAVRDRTPATVRLSTEQLQYIANTEFVPKSMRGKLPAILACVATGRELGLGDMVALRTIHVIDGRTALSAEAMVSLVRQRGHSIQGNFSGDSCTVTGKRADNGDEMTVTWTKEMAQDAGLLGKDNWRKYTPSMLWARAVSQLCRMLFADCFAGGGTYTPDEIGDGADENEWDDDVAALEPRLGAVGDGGAEAGFASGEPHDASPAADEKVGAAITGPQKKKLDVLVGTLRDAARLSTEHLYSATGRDPATAERDDEGVLHWAPLRDSLSKDEASGLIERLEKFAETVAATDAVAGTVS